VNSSESEKLAKFNKKAEANKQKADQLLKKKLDQRNLEKKKHAEAVAYASNPNKNPMVKAYRKAVAEAHMQDVAAQMMSMDREAQIEFLRSGRTMGDFQLNADMKAKLMQTQSSNMTFNKVQGLNNVMSISSQQWSDQNK